MGNFSLRSERVVGTFPFWVNEIVAFNLGFGNPDAGKALGALREDIPHLPSLVTWGIGNYLRFGLFDNLVQTRASQRPVGPHTATYFLKKTYRQRFLKI